MELRLVLIPLILLTLTACGSSGKPKTFFEQEGPLPEEIVNYAQQLLPNGEDPNLVPLVQRNFLEGCMIGGENRGSSISTKAMASACACAYEDLLKYVRQVTATENAAFELFDQLDKSLREDAGYATLGSDYKEIFDRCLS